MVRKATLTRAPLPGKGKGKGGCRGRKSPASASPEATALELIAGRLFETNRYLSIVAHVLRVATYQSLPTEGQPRADAKLPLPPLNTKDTQTYLDFGHAAGEGRKETLPSCDDLDPALAEHLFGGNVE